MGEKKLRVFPVSSVSEDGSLGETKRMTPTRDNMRKNTEKRLKPGTLWVIWGTMLLLVFLYVGIGFMVSRYPSFNNPFLGHGKLALLRLVLYIISLAMTIMSIILGRKIYSRVDHEKQKEVVDTLPKPRSGSKSIPQLFIISWTLAEGNAVFGLVLFLLSNKFPDLIGFAIIGILLLVINRPRFGSL